MKSAPVFASAVLLCSLLSVSCGSSTEGTAPASNPPQGVIDRPQNGAVIHDGELFGGWAAQASGIQSVGIYADGQFLVNALLGVDRPDVLKAFPQYGASMVTGWNVMIRLSSLNAGPHVFIAKIKSKSGLEKDLPVHVTLAK